MKKILLFAATIGALCCLAYPSWAQPGIDESFSLSIFNRSDTAKDFSWSVVAGVSAAKAIPPVPEPSVLAMTLCGLLLLAMRHAACAQRR